MSFANLPLAGVLAGIAALAGLLVLLQLLRVRHVQVTVPTTIFWRAAAREAPVRVLRGVFRHLLAYFLVLAICVLLWLAFAGPEVADDAAAYRVLFLDGSAHAAGGDDFQQAVDALKTDLAQLPSGRREVVWGGARNIKLLRPGEDSLLLERRLAALAPEAAPSALNELLRLLALPGDAPDALDVVIYGRAPADAAVLAGLPSAMRVSRATDYPPGGANAGITALGVAPAASGRWDRVDVLIRTAGSADGVPTVRINGAALDPERFVPGIVVVRELVADGSLFEARIDAGDALAIDDAAWLRLPDRAVVGVALAGDLDAAVRHAVEADPGLEVVAEGAAVAVRRRGDRAFGDLPALEFAPADQQQAAFQIAYAGDAASHLALRASIAALGLAQIDAAGLAAEAQRPVVVELRPAERAGISAWQELLAQYNFTDSRSFPLFVSKAVRWLAAAPAWHPYLAAGRPVPATSAGWSLEDRREPAFDALGGDYVLGAGTTAADAAGRDGPVVALLSDAVATRDPGAPLAASRADGGFAGTPVVTWLILAALLLLGGEWFLYQRGLMP